MTRIHPHWITRAAALTIAIATIAVWPLEVAHCAWMAAARAASCDDAAAHACCPKPAQPDPDACFCADSAPASMPASETQVAHSPLTGKLIVVAAALPSLAPTQAPAIWRDVGEARAPAAPSAPSRALRAPPTLF